MTIAAGKSLEAIQEKIKKIGSLPTLPDVAVDVMKMAANESITMAEVADRIDGDPAVSSKLLRVANSSLYGLPRAITTTEGAILVLGLKQVQNVILSVSVFSAFPQTKGKPSFDREKFWQHCSGVGLLARLLGNRLTLVTNGEEFSGGVLHDVGKIVLDQYFHDQFVQAMELAASQKISMLEAEQKVFGTTHHEIGGWLLQLWNLPDELSTIVNFHHNPEQAVDHRSLVALVALGNSMAKQFQIGLVEDPDAAELELHPAWQILRSENRKLTELDAGAAILAVQSDLEERKKRGELNWLK